jgi:hypothetical protein
MHRNAGVSSKRMPLSGSLGGEYAGDIQVSTGHVKLLGQVKARRKCMWKTLLTWLEGHDILFVKEDRQAPYVFMPWSVYIEMAKTYDEYYNGGAAE